MKKYKTPEEFIAGHPEWQQLLVSLRNIFLSTELEETIKWSVPVYTLKGHVGTWGKWDSLLNCQGGTWESLLNCHSSTAPRFRFK